MAGLTAASRARTHLSSGSSVSRAGARASPAAGSEAGARRRRGPGVAAALPLNAEWLAGQATAAAAIVAAANHMGWLDVAPADDEGAGGGECPSCGGTGRAACACTQWSDDGEGCGACNFTAVAPCRSCGGGGRRVAVPIRIRSDDNN